MTTLELRSADEAPRRKRIDYDDYIRVDRIDGSVYTDPDVFEDEFDRIWHRGWVYVGHASEVREAGDYVLRTLGRVPVILSRSSDGEVHLVINRCPHRGNRVVNDESGNSNNFRCEYHAWTFSNRGDLLGVPYPQGYPKDFSKADYCMQKVARVEIYRGFVFASLARTGITLMEHLGGGGKDLIDRMCEVAPAGEIEVRSGSLKHRMRCNWKMVVENNTDGYHPQFVHSSLFKVRITPKREAAGQAKTMPRSKVRDWGNGNAELDSRAMKKASGPLGWLPRLEKEVVDGYVAALAERVGPDKAMELALEGPPHATIFPNLFLGSGNIIVQQPVAPNECIQYVSPISLKGYPELDRTIMVHAQGGLGPAGLLFADDDEIAERNQMGLASLEPRWIYLARGLEREELDETAVADSLVSDGSDETSQRAFWKRYHQEMREEIDA